VKPANLAGRPFVNERLPNLVFAAALVVMLGLTIRHALLVRALLPDRTSKLYGELTRLEEESKALRAEQVRLRAVAPEPKALARWVVIKELVDRRAFSWTTLFARLEDRLPDGARLVSIAPTLRRGEILLDVNAVVRTPEVGWQLVRVLEDDGAFEDVFPLTEGESGEFHYTMRYKPGAAPAATGPAAVESPAPEEGEAAADEGADAVEEEEPADDAPAAGAPARRPELPRPATPRPGAPVPVRPPMRPPVRPAAPPGQDATPSQTEPQR
jgi:hypothetical protein